MREILFRGKRVDNGEWVEGYLLRYSNGNALIMKEFQRNELVDPSTVGQYTGLTDKNGKKIFEGDIVQYLDDDCGGDGWDCQSVVRFGQYNQDGSDGEYTPTPCSGWFAAVDNFTCPDWTDDPSHFPEYHNERSLIEIAEKCEVIGNIHDNPELVGGEK